MYVYIYIYIYIYIYKIYILYLTASGLWTHSSNLFDLTLEYVHADGIECMHVALYEVSPMLNQWDSSSKIILHF